MPRSACCRIDEETKRNGATETISGASRIAKWVRTIWLGGGMAITIDALYIECQSVRVEDFANVVLENA